MTARIPTRELFGAQVAALTMAETVAAVEAAILAGSPLQIGVVNAAKLVNMRRQPRLRDAVLSCDLILADGMAVVWASRLLGRPLPERVAGIDLMTALLARGNQRRWRVYCLGAEPSVIEAAIAAMTRSYPEVEIVGRHHGYFTEIDEPRIADAIAASKPHVLLVGMTSPKKEEFIARWHDRLAVPVCHGVGGSFDVLAGKVQRAPLIWQRAGLEWLYRVLQEPGRLWRRYLVTNVLFIHMVAREALQAQTWLARARRG